MAGDSQAGVRTGGATQISSPVKLWKPAMRSRRHSHTLRLEAFGAASSNLFIVVSMGC